MLYKLFAFFLDKLVILLLDFCLLNKDCHYLHFTEKSDQENNINGGLISLFV